MNTDQITLRAKFEQQHLTLATRVPADQLHTLQVQLTIAQRTECGSTIRGDGKNHDWSACVEVYNNAVCFVGQRCIICGQTNGQLHNMTGHVLKN